MQYLVIGSSQVRAKYQLSSFNIVEAIKERGQKLPIIDKILISNFTTISQLLVNMRSLYAKFQPSSFKTEGGNRGMTDRRTVKMQNFIEPLLE